MNDKPNREQRLQSWMENLAMAENAVAEIIKPIVDKYDPEQLMALGCPSDEYEPTCKRIASGIVREGMGQMSVEELSNLLAFSCHYSFNLWSERVQYYNVFTTMAEEILPLLPQTQSESL